MKARMKLTFLGSGSAFTVGDNYHSNMLLESADDKRFLIDCGTDIRLSLYARGLTYADIDHVYISHLHGDHCGGLEWLGFTRKFDLQSDRPHLYAHESIIDPLWETRLRGGMQTLEEEHATLETFFHVHALKDGFEWEGIAFQCVKVMHIFNGPDELPTYGLMLKSKGKRVFITTDTQFAPEILAPFYEEADLIFQDCETSEQHSGVHAHFESLTKLPLAIKNKMWLYHYNPGPLPDAKKHGFLGFVKRGQQFDL